jgi:hypothetical protein
METPGQISTEIDKQDNWRIVDEPPVLFLRAPGMLALPDPKRCDPKRGIALLQKQMRARTNSDFVIIVAFMLDALGGRGPISTGLRRLPTIKVTLPRMATFAQFAMGCETTYWPEGTFAAAYEVNARNAVADALNANIAVSTFRDFMEDRPDGKWKGTATQLHAALIDRIRKPEHDAAEAHRKAVAARDADSQTKANDNENNDLSGKPSGSPRPQREALSDSDPELVDEDENAGEPADSEGREALSERREAPGKPLGQTEYANNHLNQKGNYTGWEAREAECEDSHTRARKKTFDGPPDAHENQNNATKPPKRIIPL